MQDLNNFITGSTLTAAEFVEIPTEIQNVIGGLGITLSSGDLNQLGKAIAGYVSNGTFYTDSGLADAYVLSVVGLKQIATAYTEGFKVSFIAGNDNAGASTVNVAGLGVKSLKTVGGGVVPSGYIKGGESVTATFDGTDFILSNPLSNFIIPFDTLADAETSTLLREGSRFKTAERSTGEGGGGTYDVVLVGTTPGVDLPDTKKIIVNIFDNSICFVLRKTTFIRPYGAVNGSNSDNSGAISAAIDDASIGGTVDLEGLTYGTLGNTINKKIKFINGNLNLLDAATQSAITVTANGVEMDDIKTFMDTGAIAATDASGIFVNGADDVTLTRCEGDGAVAAGLLHAAIYFQDGKNATLIDCVGRNSLKEGIITRNTNNVTYIRCKGYDNGLSGVATSTGIGLLAVDCYGENSGASGVSFNSQDMHIIRPKSKNNLSQNGITVGHNLLEQDAGNVVIEHPEVIGAPNIGMFVIGSYNFTLIGGRFINCGDTALKITPRAFIDGTVNIHGGLVIDGVASALPAWAGTVLYQRTKVVVPTTLNGFAYRVIEEGTSDSSEPTFPTTLGDTVVDGTVTWEAYQLIATPATIWIASRAYSLGDRVLSPEFIGFVFECTTAGTSDSSEPVWDTTINNTTADNTVVWTTIRLLGANGIEVTSGGGVNDSEINISGFSIKNVAGTSIGITADEHMRVSNGHIDNTARAFRLNGTFVDKSGNNSDTFVDGDITVGTDIINLPSHPFSSAESVQLSSTGILPAGLSESILKFYFVGIVDADNIQLYDDAGLTSLVDITAAAGGGAHFIGTSDVRVGTPRLVSVTDVALTNIKRSAFRVGNVGELTLDNVAIRGVCTDGEGEPIIDLFTLTGGQSLRKLPLPNPLNVRNVTTKNIDAASIAFINSPESNFDSDVKVLNYNNNRHDDLSTDKFFVNDDTGTSKYTLHTDVSQIAKLFVLTTNQTLTTGVDVEVSFNAIAKDIFGMADIANNAIIVQSDGMYMVGGKLTFGSSTTGGRKVHVYINGTVYDNVGAARNIGEDVLIWNEPIELNKGDVITMHVQQESGGNLDILAFSNDTRSNFYVHKVSD